MNARVRVVGGGLAGITAALRLADAGCRVTLHEARPRLGGLTHSFQRDGLWIDNGQHVFMRCCTSYLALLDRLGVADKVTLQQRLDVPVRSASRPGTSRLRRTSLPAPLHLAAALATYRWLPPLERARLVPAALALGRVDRDDPATDRRSFADWLADHHQSPRAIETVWDLIGIATLNARADRASLALAATVFQLGLLEETRAADMGWSRVPLQHLHGDAAMAALAEAGAEVRLGSRVSDLSELDAEAVVVAVPPAEASRLVPELPADLADRLGSSPILNLHLVYDRQVLDEPFLGAVDSPLQWVFDRTSHSGLTQGQYVAVSLSAAEQEIDLPVADLRARFVPHVEALLPGAASATLRDFFVTRERHATFLPAPGTAGIRPAVRTSVAGVYLAGAWTATGWPATMEGAVRSGESAAEALLSEERLLATAQPRQVAGSAQRAPRTDGHTQGGEVA